MSKETFVKRDLVFWRCNELVWQEWQMSAYSLSHFMLALCHISCLLFPTIYISLCEYLYPLFALFLSLSFTFLLFNFRTNLTSVTCAGNHSQHRETWKHMPTFTMDGGLSNVPFVIVDFPNKPTSKITFSFIRVRVLLSFYFFRLLLHSYFLLSLILPPSFLFLLICYMLPLIIP